MSPQVRTRRDGAVRPARHRAVQPWAVAWLTLVWVALWGDLSVANVVSGAVIGVGVSLVFPLPPVRMDLRLHPVWLGWLLLRFLSDVGVASAQVAWTTLTRAPRVRNAVVRIQLETSSDFVLTLVGEMASLVPGSVIIEADRSSYTLFIHELDVRDAAGVERARERIRALERRVVRAFGAGTPSPHPSTTGGAP